MTFLKKILVTALEVQPHWIKQGEHFAYNPASMTKSRLGFKYLEVFSDPNADILKFKAPEGYSLVEIKVKGKFPTKWVYRAKLKQQTTVTGQTNLDFSEFDKLFEDRYAYEDWFSNFGEYEENPEQAYDEIYKDFIKDLKRHAKTGSNGVLVYRSIRLKALEDFKEENLGTAWTYAEGQAQTYFKTSKGNDYVLVGEAPADSIDYEDTMLENMRNQISEHELRCHGTIYLLKVLNAKGEAVKEYNPPLKTHTGSGNAGVWTGQ